MIIDRLDLLAFGQFTDVSLDLSAGPHRFHLVYGANESGKSTCMRAITSLLFGIATRTTDNYLHPNPKMRVGAKLSGTDGESLTVIRRKTGKSKLNAEDDKTPIDEASLSQLLGGIDQDTFHQRFGMSHDELVAGGKAILESKGELGTILFAAGAGISQLKSIQSQLDDDHKALFLANARKPIIQTLLKELDEKRKELRQLQTLPAEYKQLCDQLSESQRHAEQLSSETLICQRQKEQLVAYQSMLAVVPQWRAANQRLRELDSVPMLDEDFAARRRESARDREHLAKSVESLGEDLAALEKQLDETSQEFQILDHEDDIVSLFQAIGARHGAAAETKGLRDRVEELSRRLLAHLTELEIELEADADQATIDNAIAKVHVNESTHIRIRELAAEYKLIRANENDDKQRLDILQKQLSELNDELERTPVAEDPAVIESILNEIGSPDTLLSSVAQRQVECDDLRAECVRLSTELRVGQLDLAQATRLQVPSLGQIDEHDTLMSDAQQQHSSIESQLGAIRERRKTAEESLRQLRSDLELPTEDQLSDSRQKRDSTVQDLQLSEQDSEQIQAGLKKLQVEITGSDQVVDTMRSHHQQVAERTSAQKEIESLDLKISQTEKQLATANKRVESEANAWSQLCASIWSQMGVETATVRSMRSWVTKHQSLVDKHESLCQSQSRLSVVKQSVDRSKNRLASVLKTSLASRPVKLAAAESDVAAACLDQSDGESVTLETLYDAALRLRSELVTASRHAAHLAQKRDDVSADILQAESSHESSVNSRVQWDQNWQLATEKLAGEQILSPSVIDARLERLGTIQNDQRERDTLVREIQTIELADQSFATRTTETARLLNIKHSETTKPADLANRLHGLLQESKTNFSGREKLSKDLSTGRDKLAAMSETLDLATAQLTELCNEAGVKDPAELPAVEQLSREKSKLIDERDSTAKQLALVASGTGLSEFAEQVERQTSDELKQQIAELETTLQDLLPRREESLQKVGAIKQELAKIDGGDRAAELNQDIQFLTAKIQRHAQEYAKLKVASMILQRSIDHYRTENESPVLKIACDAFRELTCKKYSGLRAEYDENGNSKLFGVIAGADSNEANSKDSDEVLVPVETMSLGTADALYLSMRLASLEHQLSGGQAAPVVIDDCLIQLDDARTTAALKRFSNLSLQTQVILFTHHKHLIDLASKTLGKEGCHIHHLSS